MSPQAKTFLSSAVEASEIVADMLKTNFRVDVDPEDMEKVEGMLAKEVRRETFRAANSAKYERELDEKYGLLKDVILHPTIQVRSAETLSEVGTGTRKISKVGHQCSWSWCLPSLVLWGGRRSLASADRIDVQLLVHCHQ